MWRGFGCCLASHPLRIGADVSQGPECVPKYIPSCAPIGPPPPSHSPFSGCDADGAVRVKGDLPRRGDSGADRGRFISGQSQKLQVDSQVIMHRVTLGRLPPTPPAAEHASFVKCLHTLPHSTQQEREWNPRKGAPGCGRKNIVWGSRLHALKS